MKIRLIFFFPLVLIIASSLSGQTPCSGTPGANFIVASSTTVCAGGTVTLSLYNTYTTTGISYQWQSSTISAVGPWQVQAGATGSTYTSQPLFTSTFFQVVITCTNSGQMFTTNIAVMVLPCTTPCNGSPGPNSINLSSPTVCAGGPLSMSLSNSYLNQSGITVQWGISNSQGGPYSAIQGATLNTYTHNALANNAYFNAVVTCTNSNQSYTVNPVPVTVVTCTGCVGTPGTNTIIPSSHTVCAGNTVSLSLANTYTASGINYLWSFSTLSAAGPFTPIPGPGSANVLSAPLYTTTYFQVIISCSNSAQMISSSVSVVVLPCNSPCSGSPGANTIVPASQTVCLGSNANLLLSNTNLTLSGITYQWRSSTVLTGPYIAINGANSNSLVLASVASNQYVDVVITCTNGGQSYTTAPAHVGTSVCAQCTGVPPSNILVPSSPTVCYGGTVSLAMVNSYTSSGIIYSWQTSTFSASGPFIGMASNGSTAISSSITVSTFFSVIITCTNSGLTNSAATAVMVVSCFTGMDNLPEVPELKFSAFPNPANSELFVIAPYNIQNKLTLLDARGMVIELFPIVQHKTRIDMSLYPKGLYLIQFCSPDSRETLRIIKE